MEGLPFDRRINHADLGGKTHFKSFDASVFSGQWKHSMENMGWYGPELTNKIKSELVDNLTICWEDEYGYNGGWRMGSPGQASEVKVMHDQALGNPVEWNNGLYLAGEAMSWYGLSGWIDGAIKTGIQAAASAVNRVNSSG